MLTPTLSIIIVKYRCDSYLKNCLNLIKPDITQEIIIVDNDKDNVGFAAGCNEGAKKAKGKYLFFLNPDTQVLKNSLKIMQNFLEQNPEVGVIGPKIFSDNKGTRQLSFCRFPGPLTSLVIYSPLKKIWKNSQVWKKFIYHDKIDSSLPIEVEAVSGAALMIKKDVFNKVGGFNTNFFFYFEDNDLCRSVQEIGKKVYYFPQAEIVHFGGKSTSSEKNNEKYFRSSRYFFFKKNYGFILACLLEGVIRFLEFCSKVV